MLFLFQTLLYSPFVPLLRPEKARTASVSAKREGEEALELSEQAGVAFLPALCQVVSLRVEGRSFYNVLYQSSDSVEV
jgi:hypothetical protein